MIKLVITEGQLEALIKECEFDISLEKKDSTYALKYKNQFITDGFLKKHIIYEILLTLAMLSKEVSTTWKKNT